MKMKNDIKIIQTFSPVICIAATLWIVEAVNLMTGHALIVWGILPRTVSGLWGIPLSPFIHAGVMHLFLNTGPLVILGGIIVLYGKRVFVETTLLIALVGGVGLWIVGRPSYHVGASGLIFGYFGFLVTRGIRQKSISAILVSVVTVFAYGGLVWGLLPTFSRVSWEGHLCGLLAGAAAAWFEKK